MAGCTQFGQLPNTARELADESANAAQAFKPLRKAGMWLCKLMFDFHVMGLCV